MELTKYYSKNSLNTTNNWNLIKIKYNCIVYCKKSIFYHIIVYIKVYKYIMLVIYFIKIPPIEAYTQWSIEPVHEWREKLK